jgi:hypothetical protein
MSLIIISQLLEIRSDRLNVNINVKKKMIRILEKYSDLRKWGLWLNDVLICEDMN